MCCHQVLRQVSVGYVERYLEMRATCIGLIALLLCVCIKPASSRRVDRGANVISFMHCSCTNFTQRCCVKLSVTLGNVRLPQVSKSVSQDICIQRQNYRHATTPHWLDIPGRIIYKLGVMTYGCQHGKAPQYPANCCTPVSDCSCSTTSTVLQSSSS